MKEIFVLKAWWRTS
ncbi:trp operon leader peptide [Shigella sonnei]|nr:trp operon leader peptide [Shigella sonnei]